MTKNSSFPYYFLMVIILFANTKRVLVENNLLSLDFTIHLVVIFAVLLLVNNGFKVKKRMHYFVVTLYAILTNIQNLLLGRESSVVVIYMGIILFVFLVLFDSYGGTDYQITLLFNFYSILGLVATIWILYNNLGLLISLAKLEVVQIDVYISLIGNKNADAAFLLFSIMSSFILYKLNYRKMYLIIFGLQMLAVLLTFSRGVYLAILVFFIVYYFFYETRIYRKVFATFLFVLFSSALVLYGTLLDFLLDNFLRIERGLSSRDLLFNLAVDLFKDNIMSGIGYGQWEAYTGYTYIAHNAFIQTFVDFGLVSGLIHALFYIGVVYSIFISLNRNKRRISDKNKLLLVFSLAIVLALISYSVFEACYFGGSRGVEINAIIFLTISIMILSNTKKSGGKSRHHI